MIILLLAILAVGQAPSATDELTQIQHRLMKAWIDGDREYVDRTGIQMITIWDIDEWGIDKTIERILDIMRYLKMLDGEPQVASGQLRAVTQFLVTARRGGLIRTHVKVGDELKTGQLLAEVVDMFGDVVERIEAPRDGIARIVWTHRVVNTGDSVVRCWVAEPAPPFPALAAYTKP